MLVVMLRFSANKAQAAQHMDGHNAWIERGFADGIFLMTGSLPGGAGGAVLAHNIARDDLEARLQDDPFVAEKIVDADILEIRPGRVDERLAFLTA